MTPSISDGVLLLIRAAVCRRTKLEEADFASSERLRPTAIPGVVYSPDGDQRGLYIESSLLEPRALRGGPLLTLTHEVDVDRRSGSLTSSSVQFAPINGDDSRYAILRLGQSSAVECVVTDSGYVIFPDDWVRSALQQLYRDVLGGKSIETASDVFELGGSSRNLQLLLLSVNAIFATRIDAREFFANSSIDAVAKMLAAVRIFQPSPLLEMIGESNG